MIIRSLDIGYQVTKMLRRKDKKWEYFSIPSIAPLHSGVDMSAGLLHKRNTEIVSGPTKTIHLSGKSLIKIGGIVRRFS